MAVQESHAKPVEHLTSEFQTNLERGLTTAQAGQRLQEHGPNELKEKPRPGFLSMVIDQFNNFLVILLLVAAFISLLLGEYVDASAIFIIVALNAVVGVIQESKAEAALAALKKMAASTAQVMRDGRQVTLPARELVPGDIVLVEAGNNIPADLRLVESVNLKVAEASLTGESVAVEKVAHVVLDKDIPLGDRRNSAFMSTLATYGRGRGLVIATGMHTQIGLIAEMIQAYEEEDTPLQMRLDQLAKALGIICLVICGLIFVYGIFIDTNYKAILTGPLDYLTAEKKTLVELFMTAVSLAIAAVPEGLPAVVTICLALGMRSMIQRHALIRKLASVETLGCTTVICSDKTGTLTQHEMTVVQGWVSAKRFAVSGEGFSPKGGFTVGNQALNPADSPDAALLFHGSAACNDAILEQSGEEHGETSWRIVGDPTEGALVVVAAKAGVTRKDLNGTLPRVAEIPFDSDRKRMTTVHQTKGSFRFELPPTVAFCKGAPDVMLELCTSVTENGKPVPLTSEKKAEILAANQAMARQALRVLGLAYRGLDSVPAQPTPEAVEKGLTFVGLLGMIDPARPEVKEAVAIARKAGLKTVMVTGDYKDTAEAIAREIGILVPGGKVVTGAELDKMSDEELARQADQICVCCRVSPTHKTKIVDAFKARGHVVAMTGDGVNDAPALKRANIGISMGITGTDVSKETADMVLTDDNYASIVAAIEEGRIIYSNIRKFVYYLISCNIGEILIIFFAMLFGWPLPLRPVQLLMLNLVTDGAPALALGMEKGDKDIMSLPPRPTKEPIINWEMQIGTAVQAVVMTAAVLWAYWIAQKTYPDDLAHAQTIAFTTLCVSELLRAFTARSEHYSMLATGLFSNKWMLWANGSSFLLVLIAVYVPFLNPFFGTVPLSASDWLLMLPFMFLASIAAEITKIYLRWKAAQLVAVAH